MKFKKTKEQSFRTGENSVFHKKRFLARIGIILAILVMSAVFYFSGMGCLWNYLFGINCLGCGITRAYISLLSGDIMGAFRHNFMFFSVPILFLYILFYDKLFKKKRHIAVAVLISIGFLVNWLIKL